MKRDYFRIFLSIIVLIVFLFTSVAVGQESNGAYKRRSYQLGATLSEVRAIPFPDDKDWPGARLFFSSEHPFVPGEEDWVPIQNIRETLPFQFTDEELEGSPPQEVNGEIFHFQPPPAYMPQIIFSGKWADAGVISGEFYYPEVDRETRVDGKPRIYYRGCGLWLGDVWNWTKLYFYQPDSADEPILFYIETTGRSDHFDHLKALFQQAYGEPTSVSDEIFQNRMGASFRNDVVVYRNEVSSMVLYRYGDDLDTGRLVHVHWPTYQELQKKLEKQNTQAANRL
jgi:hypothetical protein